MSDFKHYVRMALRNCSTQIEKIPDDYVKDFIKNHIPNATRFVSKDSFLDIEYEDIIDRYDENEKSYDLTCSYWRDIVEESYENEVSSLPIYANYNKDVLYAVGPIEDDIFIVVDSSKNKEYIIT